MPASAPRPMWSLPWSSAPPQSSSTLPLPRPTIRSAWRPPCATRSKPGAMRISPAAFRAAAVPSLQARSSGWSAHETLMKQLPSPLLVITDRHQARYSIEAIAEEVGQGGGRWLMLRDKDLEPRERRDLAAHLAEIARRHGMHLSVSRDVALAAECGASVHLQ